MLHFFIQVVEAPAHESHVLEMHRTGNKFGGIHPFFWFLIAAIIITFHAVLFRLIYNEYCVNDKYRFRYYTSIIVIKINSNLL